MEYSKKQKSYSIRLELTTDLINVWEDFIHAVDTFEKSSDVKLNIGYWYDSKKQLRKDISFATSITSQPISMTDSVIFDIRKLVDDPSKIENCKYYFLYTDSNSFISSVFELFSFIKARLNYEELKNENRNDRKQAFRKKTGDQKPIVDAQIPVSGSGGGYIPG
jgi:hypothetical protein